MKKPWEKAGQPEEPIVLPDDAWREVETAVEEEAPLPKKRRWSRRHLGRRLRLMVPGLVAAVLYVALVVCLFLNAAATGRSEGTLSLRYNTALTKEQVDAAKYTLGDPELKKDFTATWWQEVTAQSVTTSRATVETPVFVADGDVATVLDLRFVQGSYPAPLEAQGVALSENLAWELFGGIDIIGAELTWLDKPYAVRGVFAGNQNQMVAQVAAAKAPVEGFAGLDLAGETQGDPREAAEAFAQTAGLPVPDYIASTGTLPSLLWALAWLPAAVLVLWFAGKCLGLVRRLAYWKRQLVWFGLLVAAALALPAAMDLLPGWAIPSQWSNLQHWAQMGKEIQGRFTELLALPPNTADVQVRQHLVGQVVLVVPALFALTAAIRWWSRWWRGNSPKGLGSPGVHIPLQQALPARQSTPLPEGEERPFLLPEEAPKATPAGEET